MARPRKELTPEQERRIVECMARGLSADEIARLLGISKTTAHRRMAELKSQVPAARAAKRNRIVVSPESGRKVLDKIENPGEPTPKLKAIMSPDADVPEEIPEGVDLATVDKWIPKVERAAEAAEREENYAAFASLTARLVALLDHKRKATPLPKIDPNDSPDMLAAAERVRKRWHELVNMEMGG